MPRLDHRGGVLPLVLLLVFQHEVVAHHDQVSIVVSVFECATKNVSKYVQTGSSLTLVVVDLHSGVAIEELEEVHCLDNATDGVFFLGLIASKVSVVCPADHALDEQLVIHGHAVGELITNLLPESSERGSGHLGEAPEAKIF